ncbi:MAG: hypothetical protein P8R04_05360, partial [Gammaproteobacteria bacterium]|nr:hypothetical protein [Gammaproteobacteria bacterium]
MAGRLIFPLLCLLLNACGHQPAYNAAMLQQWNEVKAEQGPTFAGSAAWQAHMDFLEAGFASTGVVAQAKYPVPYRRWWASDEPKPAERSLIIKGESLVVASYWAYSGGTPPDGVTAPLLLYKKGMSSEQLAGHIVVFQVAPVPASMGQMFKVGREYSTDDFSDVDTALVDDQWYQSNYVTRFGRFDRVLRDSGAVGAVVVFSMSADRLSGLYTFPLLAKEIIDVPGLYVDAATGEDVIAAAVAGHKATLTLIAHEAQ